MSGPQEWPADLARSPANRTLTIAEAADLTGATVKAIRNRVDRGQLRTLKRAGVRRIPLSELRRAGLLEPAGDREGELQEDAGLGEAIEAARGMVSRELLAELAAAHERIGKLQALEAVTESSRRELELERRRREELEHELQERELELERLRSRSLLERLRNR